jgi:trimeric autotransporter adhesin
MCVCVCDDDTVQEDMREELARVYRELDAHHALELQNRHDSLGKIQLLQHSLRDMQAEKEKYLMDQRRETAIHEQDLVLRTNFVLRTMARAFRGWSEQLVTRVRLKEMSTRILLRWTHGAMSRAWTTWYEEYVTAKRHALKAHKIVCRWENIKYARAFARWEEQTAEQRNLRVAGSKVVKRWTHTSQALAWGKWQEEVRRRRMVKKAALRWTQKTLYATWSTWGALVTEGKRMRTIGAKVCLRWQQRTVAGAWMTWQCKYSAIDAQKRHMALASQRIVSRWINLALSPAMSRWMGYVEEKKRMVRAADKVVFRWQNMCLAPAWARWEEQWREEKRMRRSAETVIRRRQNMRLASAWAVWQEAWEQERERVVLSLNEALAAAKSDKDAAERQVGRLTDNLKKGVERQVGHLKDKLKKRRAATAFNALKERAAEPKTMRMAGSKVVLQRQQLGLRRCLMGWSEHAARQRRVALAAVYRMQRMQLWAAFARHVAPAWARWEEQWREEKRMRRATETVIRRRQNMRLASAWAVWQEAWEQERERVVLSLNEALAAAKSDKDAAERQVGRLTDKLKKRSRRVVDDMRVFDLATTFLLFQNAVEEARWHEQLRTTREEHECIMRKLSEELETEVSHARAVASQERQNRLAAVQHLFSLQRRMQLSQAFSMFTDAIFRRLEYCKMAAKVIETWGMPTLDVAVMSFLRWRHFIHLQHSHLHQNRVEKLQADLRLAEEENGIIAAQNTELEEKLVRAALEAERLELHSQELHFSKRELKAVTEEKDKLEARLQEIEKEMADSIGNAGKEVKRLKEELDARIKKKLEGQELAKETGALALIQEDQANASAKAHNAELEEKLDRASLEAERLQLQNQKLQCALLALIQEDHANASAKAHVLDLVGTSARSFASMSSVSRHARAEASIHANGVLDDKESLAMRRRAREEIRALAEVMCREGVVEDTVSISMTERQEAHQRKHLDAIGLRVYGSLEVEAGAGRDVGGGGGEYDGRGRDGGGVSGWDGGVGERLGSKKESALEAQSPAHWTSGFKFLPGDSGVGEGEDKDALCHRILRKAGVGNAAAAHGASGWTLTPDGSWTRMQPGADERLRPPTPSPRDPSPAGRSGGGGNRHVVLDRAISISQPSPINLASVPMGGREGWGKL